MSASVDCTRRVNGFLWQRVTGGMRPGSTILNPNSSGNRLNGTTLLDFAKQKKFMSAFGRKIMQWDVQDEKDVNLSNSDL